MTELMCPQCGENNLHQGAVRVYNRADEDGPVACVAVNDAEHVEFCTGARAIVENPSGRRQGLTIQMDCEQCGDVGLLAIYQHKGTTRIEWQL